LIQIFFKFSHSLRAPWRLWAPQLRVLQCVTWTCLLGEARRNLCSV